MLVLLIIYYPIISLRSVYILVGNQYLIDTSIMSSDYLLPDLYEASISELQYGLEEGHFKSVDLVKVRILIDHSFGHVDKPRTRPTSQELMK